MQFPLISGGRYLWGFEQNNENHWFSWIPQQYSDAATYRAWHKSLRIAMFFMKITHFSCFSMFFRPHTSHSPLTASTPRNELISAECIAKIQKSWRKNNRNLDFHELQHDFAMKIPIEFAIQVQRHWCFHENHTFSCIYRCFWSPDTSESPLTTSTPKTESI